MYTSSQHYHTYHCNKKHHLQHNHVTLALKLKRGGRNTSRLKLPRQRAAAAGRKQHTAMTRHGVTMLYSGSFNDSASYQNPSSMPHSSQVYTASPVSVGTFLQLLALQQEEQVVSAVFNVHSNFPSLQPNLADPDVH